MPRASWAPTGARVASAGDATPAAGFVPRPVGVARTAAGPAATVRRQVVRTAAAACGPAATEADAAHPTCRGSSAGVACTRGEAVVPHRRDEVAPTFFRSRAQAWLPQPAVAAARSLAASPADAWPGRAGAPVAGVSPAPRFEGESSAERIVPPVSVVAAQQVTRQPVRALALRLSLRQPVILRLLELLARSRQGVLHRFQREAVVRPRRRVVAPRRRPGLRQAAPRRLRPVAARASVAAVAAQVMVAAE